MKYRKETLNWDYLFEILDYNSNTGIFINKITRSSRALQGAIAGTLNPDGYRYIRINNIRYSEHRLAWFYEYAKWPKEYIDHKNNIPTDNRIFNLREASGTQNNANTSCSFGTSKYKGVNLEGGKWRSGIKYKGKKYSLGTFINEIDAAKAYNN